METFQFFVKFLLVGLVSSEKDSFVFNGFRHADISLSNSSCISPDGVLIVTNDSVKLLGHAFYPSPLQFKDNTYASIFSFSTTFVFSIRQKYPDLGGHGLAFIISSTEDMKGALSNQYLGLPNDTNMANFSTRVFAVEFDIIQNPEFADINDNHVGININSLRSNISAPAAYLTGPMPKDKKWINLKSGVILQSWIEYKSSEKLVTVYLSPFGAPRPNWPLIPFPVDLSPIFIEYMYVGFSAATSLLTASHSVFGWSFRIGSPAQDLDRSELPTTLNQPQNVVKSKGFAVGITLASIILVLLVMLGTYQVVKRTRNGDGVLEDWEVEYGTRCFDYSELSAATNGFGERNLIGSGGFGGVYRGLVPSTGLEVAIKRVAHDSRQGMREFVAEITSVGRLRHRNLVQLHGWCRRKDELLLVYDYVPNGSLNKLLFNSQQKILTWEQRYKILNGIAKALVYLHSECEQRVVHRDIKSSNILIDADLNPRLGDFGLARMYEHDIHPQTTHIVGTLGYLAPELTRTGKATTCTDVFSYGTLMLEVACGRRPIEPGSIAEELVLVDWVRDLHSRGEVMKAVDPMLDHYEPEEVELVLTLGLLCSHPLPNYRPSMRRVVQFLLGDAHLPPLPPDIHLEHPSLMAEVSYDYPESDPLSYRMTSSKSTSSFSSFINKAVGNPACRSTF